MANCCSDRLLALTGFTSVLLIFSRFAPGWPAVCRPFRLPYLPPYSSTLTLTSQDYSPPRELAALVEAMMDYNKVEAMSLANEAAALSLSHANIYKVSD